MNVFVPGTPLKSLGWQRNLGKVRIRYRSPEDTEIIRVFLTELIACAQQEIDRLPYTDDGQLELCLDLSVSGEKPPTGQ
jgi:hypothetical protein